MQFDSTDPLVLWMEDEGLSGFALLKLTPRPTKTGRKLPAQVVMEWGVEDLEHEGDREKFMVWRVTAEGAAEYRCEGAIDLHEQCTVALGKGPGIDLRLEVGATITLRCQRLVVDEPRFRLREGKPRPYHGQVDLDVDLAGVTLGQMREWLRIPAALTSLARGGGVELDTPLAELEQVTIVDERGHALVWLGMHYGMHVARGKWASDALWSRVWAALPQMPGLTRIRSRNWFGAPADWPASPPPKPIPQVWPDVYGVTCDFEDMTLDDVRACAGLTTLPFLEKSGAPNATLTLGEMARWGGMTALRGVTAGLTGCAPAPLRNARHLHGVRPLGRGCHRAGAPIAARVPIRTPRVARSLSHQDA